MINFYNYYNDRLDNQQLYAEPLKYVSPMSEQYKDEVEPILHIIKKSPSYAYWYARLIKGRWIEAEPYIMRDPVYVFYYAIGVIRGRWLEAEPIIRTNGHWWESYCRTFKI